MKQTAVEWLVEQLDNLLELYPSEIQKVNSLFQQAKKIEHQQIIDAHDNGYIDGGNQKTTTAEQYYKEIFKQNN